IIVDQLGVMTTGIRPGDYFDDILLFLNTMLNVEAVKVYPGIMMRRPAFKAAKARVEELGQKVLDFHRQNPPETSGRAPDLIDDVLANKRPDGDPFTEDDLIAMAIGPYFAGMDTVASSISFLIYNILKYPDVLAKIQVEVDAAFAKGSITHKDFQQMPVLHAAVLETLRLFPATPFTPRTVIQEFEFGGYTFKVGTEVMIAQTLTHFLPEYYPDPMKFDVNRHLEKSGPRVAQTFAPYTLGAHTCLGAGLAEMQMMVTMSALLHYARLELETPGYEARIHTMPLPNPGQNFKIRVKEVHNS
ncbi:MAG TPA: cytochrome P450, partial [Phototrophicaceae bacterium]|nr:cytochrome P450 [Phototrophicaceae bacterium]